MPAVPDGKVVRKARSMTARDSRRRESMSAGSRRDRDVQAWKPDHPILKDVVNHDYVSMYLRQLAERKKFNYPPYFRLIVIRMKHKKAEILNEGAAVFTKDLREKFGKLVYGPEYPLVGRVRNFYIKQTLLKIPRGANLSEVKSNIQKSLIRTKTVTKYRSIIVQYDVDPQ